jgi:hypothetical protein
VSTLSSSGPLSPLSPSPSSSRLRPPCLPSETSALVPVAVLMPQCRTLQHHGYREYHERHGRSPRHGPPWLGVHPRTIPRTRCLRVPDRTTHRPARPPGCQAIRYHDQRGIRERHRPLHGYWRLDQCPHPPQCCGQAHRRRAQQRRLGEGRVRAASTRQYPAGGTVPLRGVPPRWRSAL